MPLPETLWFLIVLAYWISSVLEQSPGGQFLEIPSNLHMKVSIAQIGSALSLITSNTCMLARNLLRMDAFNCNNVALL
jgi:hypothetical protein